MHWLTIPVRNRVLRLFGRPQEPDFLCEPERALRCIFFHIPKTGGLAICESLFGGFHVNHRLYTKCERQDPVSLAHYWKFCIVRDPIDRFLSAYRFLKAGGMSEMDREFRACHAGAFESLEAFVDAFREETALQRYVHFRPQADFICDAKGQVRMDFLGRFEDLAGTFERITSRLRISADLVRVNRGPENVYEDSLSSDEKCFIKYFYEKDIKIISTLSP